MKEKTINWVRVSAIPGIEYIMLLEDGKCWKAIYYKDIGELPTVKEKTQALGDVDTKALLFRFLRQWGVTIYKKEYERDIYGIGIEVYSTDHGRMEVEGSLSGYCARFI